MPDPPRADDPDAEARAIEAVRAANAAFYAAFETRDLDAMSAVWEHSDRATVTHPGWPVLRGWARVLGSWDAIFANTAYLQFVLTDEVVTVAGATAWVTLDENLLQSVSPASAGSEPEAGGIGGIAGSGASDELAAARIAALNVFVRDDGRWRMVVHHGSPVSAPSELDLEP